MDLHRTLIGQSPGMRKLATQVAKAAKTRWPVLILGETGTGKEVIARSIYSHNPTGPFVTVDCSALVGPLMESELFGYAKGAFTGAVTQKLGMIEMANGGTVFLDEIGELPLEMQVKLLRVLQEKEFRPVGGLATKKSDFRVISATNRVLANEVEKESFRRDLFYRLNVITLRIAPLRERKEDIPELVNFFLAKHGNGNYAVTQELMATLTSFDWPGNVRQLENCIQHMLAVNSGPLLHTMDLPSALGNFMSGERAKFMTMAATVQERPNTTLRKPVIEAGEILPIPELEKRAIRDALRFTKGDRATAATLLGIGRTTLYRKLKEYELDAQANEAV